MMLLCRCYWCCKIVLHKRCPFQNISLQIPGNFGYSSCHSPITTREIQPPFTVPSRAFISFSQSYSRSAISHVTFTKFPCPHSWLNLRPGPSQQPSHSRAALTPPLYHVYWQPFYRGATSVAPTQYSKYITVRASLWGVLLK